jgi:hypothetical protein
VERKGHRSRLSSGIVREADRGGRASLGVDYGRRSSESYPIETDGLIVKQIPGAIKPFVVQE